MTLLQEDLGEEVTMNVKGNISIDMEVNSWKCSLSRETLKYPRIASLQRKGVVGKDICREQTTDVD